MLSRILIWRGFCCCCWFLVSISQSVRVSVVEERLVKGGLRCGAFRCRELDFRLRRWREIGWVICRFELPFFASSIHLLWILSWLILRLDGVLRKRLEYIDYFKLLYAYLSGNGCTLWEKFITLLFFRGVIVKDSWFMFRAVVSRWLEDGREKKDAVLELARWLVGLTLLCSVCTTIQVQHREDFERPLSSYVIWWIIMGIFGIYLFRYCIDFEKVLECHVKQ